MRASALSFIFILATFLFITIADTAISGDFYKWVDENGAVHYVDSPGKIPAKYKKKAKAKEFEKRIEESSVKKDSIKIKDPSYDWIKESRKNKRYPSTGGAVNFVSESTFTTEVLNSDQPVLVEFWAVWCGWCKKIDPIIEQIAAEYDDRVKVVKVDCDKDKNLKARYKVEGLPTVVLFKNGMEQKRIRGYAKKKRLVAMVEAGID